MPYLVLEFQSTPNPQALKCILDRTIDSVEGLDPAGLRSYSTAERASADAFAAALFRIPGVRGVLIGGNWFSVTKRAEADWGAIKANVEDTLRAL